MAEKFDLESRIEKIQNQFYDLEYYLEVVGHGKDKYKEAIKKLCNDYLLSRLPEKKDLNKCKNYLYDKYSGINWCIDKIKENVK